MKTRKKSKHFKNELEFKNEIQRVLSQQPDFQHVSENYPLKMLRAILLKNYNITEKEFEEQILRLYRKQMIDLQPGGNPSDYHLLSPTGKKFYYLIIKA